MTGFLLMLLVCRIDYSVLGKWSRQIAGGILLFILLSLVTGVQVYGRIRVMKSAGPLNTRKLITPKRDSFVADTHRIYGYVSIYTKDPVWSEKRDDFVNLDFTFEQGNEVKEVIRRWNL